MSEEFKEGMNEDRGMAEEHKGPQESASGIETPGGVNFTMKDTADERPSQPEQAAPVSPEQAAPVRPLVRQQEQGHPTMGMGT